MHSLPKAARQPSVHPRLVCSAGYPAKPRREASRSGLTSLLGARDTLSWVTFSLGEFLGDVTRAAEANIGNAITCPQAAAQGISHEGRVILEIRSVHRPATAEQLTLEPRVASRIR